MLSFFRKKTPEQLLHEKYEKLMKEAHRLSTINRSQSDEKYSEAQQVLDEIDEIQKK